MYQMKQFHVASILIAQSSIQKTQSRNKGNGLEKNSKYETKWK